MSSIGFGFTIGKAKKTGGVSYDADAQAFIDATGITDTTQKSAVNQLVLDLKSYNIWTKMKAVYPMVGGTSTTHKYNLKDPQDTNAAFRLTFSTGWTHSSTGATPNGSSAYINTFFNPSTGYISLNNVGFSIYNRTSNAYSGSPNHGIIPTTQTNRIYYGPRIPTTFFHCGNESGTTYRVSATISTKLGLYTNIRNANNYREMFINGISVGTNTANDTTGTIPNFNFYIGATNNSNVAANFTNDEIAFFSFHDAFTTTESSNFYTAVQTMQTTLSRNV